MHNGKDVYLELFSDSIRRIGDILIALSLAHFIFH